MVELQLIPTILPFGISEQLAKLNFLPNIVQNLSN